MRREKTDRGVQTGGLTLIGEAASAVLGNFASSRKKRKKTLHHVEKRERKKGKRSCVKQNKRGISSRPLRRKKRRNIRVG